MRWWITKTLHVSWKSVGNRRVVVGQVSSIQFVQRQRNHTCQVCASSLSSLSQMELTDRDKRDEVAAGCRSLTDITELMMYEFWMTVQRVCKQYVSVSVASSATWVKVDRQSDHCTVHATFVVVAPYSRPICICIFMHAVNTSASFHLVVLSVKKWLDKVKFLVTLHSAGWNYIRNFCDAPATQGRLLVQHRLRGWRRWTRPCGSSLLNPPLDPSVTLPSP